MNEVIARILFCSKLLCCESLRGKLAGAGKTLLLLAQVRPQGDEHNDDVVGDLEYEAPWGRGEISLTSSTWCRTFSPENLTTR